MIKSLHLIIKGRVQGVFFRASAKRKAIELDIKGFARNLDDGSVEIVAQAEKDNLDLFVEWCKHGPQAAEVKEVLQKQLGSSSKYDTFSIK